MDLETIGREVCVHRKALGMTQSELANLAGLSRATITALETGTQRELGFNKLTAILAVLKLDLRLTQANIGRPTLEDLQEAISK